MKALRLTRWGRPAELQETAIPEPGPGQILVKIAGAGACHSLPVSFFALPSGAEIATSYWGTVTELMELVALARTGKLRMDVEAFPLDQAPEVYERLRRGEIRGRAVVVPGR